ncbi:MAG: endonuclease/exonuclease/phosphatase family protein [Pseudomonadota bacterium]
MTASISIATYNIHKGLSPLNRKLVIHDVRDKLHVFDADIVLLQEVQGAHAKQKKRFANWPELPQHEHIADMADGRYTDIVYGLNVQHHHGDHGNAILSAYPIVNWVNRNVSHHRFENRGHLMARIDIPSLSVPLTCVCVHLGLFHRSRVMQIERLIEFLQEAAPSPAPLVVAGDFNDWRARHSQLSKKLENELGLVEAFEAAHGAPARTFPAILPVFTLDRIYVRGLKVEDARRLHGNVEGARWRHMSDHVGLAVTLSKIDGKG